MEEGEGDIWTALDIIMPRVVRGAPAVSFDGSETQLRGVLEEEEEEVEEEVEEEAAEDLGTVRRAERIGARIKRWRRSGTEERRRCWGTGTSSIGIDFWAAAAAAVAAVVEMKRRVPSII